MKTRTNRLTKECTLLKISVDLLIEQTFAPSGIGSSGGEWVDGEKKCSRCSDCFNAQRDCRWAIGVINSENDPLK